MTLAPRPYAGAVCGSSYQLSLVAVFCCGILLGQAEVAAQQPARTVPSALGDRYRKDVRPLLAKYCSDCHTGEHAEGSIDVAKLDATDGTQGGASLWTRLRGALNDGIMPPSDATQPAPAERERIVEWIDQFLASAAERNAGDPGPVCIRRLNNVEYANTIRALTGLPSLDPAREFPPDGAAGDGFMNVGSALSMSPALASKYYAAGKEIAKHAVFTPSGMRFFPGETQRDHTDEYIQRIREFYTQYALDDSSDLVNSDAAAHRSRAGVLPLEPYVVATIVERERLRSGRISIEQVAVDRGLNSKYLAALWDRLDSAQYERNYLFQDVRRHWESATAADARVVVGRIRAWQKALWKFNAVGRIGQEGGPQKWQEPVTPIVDRHELQLPVAQEGRGGDEVSVYLAATSLDGKPAPVLWRRPRLVRSGRDDIRIQDAWRLNELYLHERDAIFADTAKFLQAADEAFRDGHGDDGQLAARYGISPTALAAWRRFLGEDGEGPFLGDRLADQIEMVSTFDFIKGWVSSDGASVLANSSEETARTQAKFPPRSIVVHPSPTRRVMVSWQSPINASVRISASVQDAHPGCGNGIVWSLEWRRGKTKHVLWSGASNGDSLESLEFPRELNVRRGDGVVLAIGPRDGDHSCDSTVIDLTVESNERRWNMTDEAVGDILRQNPRNDLFGHHQVWHFTTESTDDQSLSAIPPGSKLAAWQQAQGAADRQRLALELEELLSGNSPATEKDPDEQLLRVLADDKEALLTSLLSLAAPLAASRQAGPAEALGVSEALFGQGAENETTDFERLQSRTGQVLAIRLPAAIAAGAAFAVEGELPAASESTAVRFYASTERPDPDLLLPDAPLVARTGQGARRQLEEMCDEFRQAFPIALCYLQMVPIDEVITMHLYYREDDHLGRLMLDRQEQAELDQLWDELLFVSQEPAETIVAFEQLLEYATQIDPQRVEKLKLLRRGLQDRLERFKDRQREAEPRQLEALVHWVSQAYRRPLSAEERNDLLELYRQLLHEELSHEEALRLLIARVLVSPHFLYRIEKPANSGDSAPVDAWELASRLSYFLWSSPPDAELRQVAATGALRKPEVLVDQARRMLADDRVRNLAVEFGCQWLNIHNFAELDEKSEKAFPTFRDVRGLMYEEAILLFTDVFQKNRSLVDLLDADYAFLNETLASHYGVPGVTGPAWRRVEGVRPHGRGGILTLGAVLAKQSGASRTSPVLRGNWLTSVVLDDALPPPPPNVPPLDDEIPEGLTERQLTERHARDPACMTCHSRIDPYGFALEQYDAIGRRRDVDSAGLAIDATATLPDGTVVEGIDGLREYLLTKRRGEFVRQFCRKLLGYALGRAVRLSDEPLLNKMTEVLQANHYQAAKAVELIVSSQQFRQLRSLEAESSTTAPSR